MTSTLTKKHSFDLIFHSQQVFRLILEAMSNPAKTVNIKKYADRLYGGSPALLAVAVTLLDNEVSFNTCGGGALPDDIVSLTFARKENIEDADFIFARAWSDMRDAIENAKCGTLADPHKSATVIVQNDDSTFCRLTLSGPGIDGQSDILTTQTVKDAIILRDAQCYEYPQGIDLLFISSDGDMLAIPRLTKLITENDSRAAASDMTGVFAASGVSQNNAMREV